MNSLYPFCSDINLHVKGRISVEDASRQERTARAILERLRDRPGLILADEVGMGKTFVALAVAISVALENRGKRPVVIMVPSTLKEKWPADFALFCEKCLPKSKSRNMRCGVAERAVDFLKMLDDPLERRNQVVFLTHGAMSRGLKDPWIRLALIRQSMYRKHQTGSLREALGRTLGDLLPELRWVEVRDSEIWSKLLTTSPGDWRRILERSGIDVDDPVPESVVMALPKLDTTSVFDELQNIPLRRSKNYDDRIKATQGELRRAMRSLWKDCLQELNLRLPLLILDEAHHLKNADTDLASLFRSQDSFGDAEEVHRGPLAGVFDRMLFLTATPFQLGHGELCSVLDRFDGIRWKGAMAPEMGLDGFDRQKEQLRAALDAAQEVALSLDHAWGKLQSHDLKVGDLRYDDVEEWWSKARHSAGLTPNAIDVMKFYERTKESMKTANAELSRWVIRHLKPRHLPEEHSAMERRKRWVGRSILDEQEEKGEHGIAVQGEAILPFLLAARATTRNPDSRPVFAEGLASSYEAFLHTRSNNGAASTDADDDSTHAMDIGDEVNWHLGQLESLIPRETGSEIKHPKIAATVKRAVEIWLRGEKVVVFCHYVATGRILRQRVSDAIHSQIVGMGAEKLGCSPDQVVAELDRIGRRFFDQDSPIRQACDQEAEELVAEYPDLFDWKADLVEIIRRNLRTPAFLVRYFPLGMKNHDETAIKQAFDADNPTGRTLRQTLDQFLKFLVERCGEVDRQRYIDAVKRIQTGSHFGIETIREYDEDELQGATADQLLPNVRLVNGATRSETRQRLMLTFNTPFYPEVLIASSVMAEGVDLHLNCRYMIHHDLCWNPSTLEQRTGRVDRIGAKAEFVGQPIHVYLPFIAETQDEKMYRVVMDRERWFNVVMGEAYKVDARTTEKLANRIPFPAQAANDLAFRLHVDG